VVWGEMMSFDYEVQHGYMRENAQNGGWEVYFGKSPFYDWVGVMTWNQYEPNRQITGAWIMAGNRVAPESNAAAVANPTPPFMMPPVEPAPAPAPAPYVPAPAPVPTTPKKTVNTPTSFLGWLEGGKPMSGSYPLGFQNWSVVEQDAYYNYLNAQGQIGDVPDDGYTEPVPVIGRTSNLSIQERLDQLETIITAMSGRGGGTRATERLTIKTSTDQSAVEAALRIGLNSGELDIQEVNNITGNVVRWLSARTGIDESRVEQSLRMTLAAGASALTMVVTGGNFPLGAAAYFAAQGLLPKATTSSNQSSNKDAKKLFMGINAEGTIDGMPLSAIDVSLPMGLPHDIFDPYRYICYDRLSRRWFPADEVEPLNYWGQDEFRYIVLDRVTSKVFHCDKVRPVRVYV